MHQVTEITILNSWYERQIQKFAMWSNQRGKTLSIITQYFAFLESIENFDQKE